MWTEGDIAVLVIIFMLVWALRCEYLERKRAEDYAKQLEREYSRLYSQHILSTPEKSNENHHL